MSKLSNAPFFRSPIKSQHIMRDVLVALIPVSIMSVVKFGLGALLLMVTGVISAVFFEYLYQKLTKKKPTISDLSACVTGLLVGLSYPVTAPLWVVILGSFIAIVLIKQLPGGIGKNMFNPAVFSRVFIKIILTPFMTNWVTPLPDMTSTATPLEFIGNGQNSLQQGLPSLYDLFMGNLGGNIGETVKWAILLGFLYLVIRGVIHAWMPLASLAGLFLTVLLFGKSDYHYALYHLLSGTVLFASVFMVTDYTSGPINPKAKLIFALGVGILTGVIRYSFDLPGAVGVAILIMNVLAPLIDGFSAPKVFGYHRPAPLVPPRK